MLDHVIQSHRHAFGKTTRQVFRTANGLIGCHMVRVTAHYSRIAFVRIERIHALLMRRIS